MTAAALKPVYALIGQDAFLQQQAMLEVLHRLPADVQRVDVDGETAALADVLDELRSFAMFGGGKAVVVRNAEALITRFRSPMEEYVANPSDSSTLILRIASLPSNQRIYKAIAKVGHIESCEPPKDLGQWIVDRAAAAHRLKMPREAAMLLAELIGADLGRLDNELAKLALTTDGKSVTADAVASAVVFQRDRQMWDLTNALAAGDAEQAVQRWRQLLQSDSSTEFRAVTWLCIWLENVRKASEMLRQGQNAFSIGQALRIWPRDMQQRFVDTVKSLGEAGRARAVNLLAQIDFQTKTGVGDAARNVERFLLTLAARDLK